MYARHDAIRENVLEPDSLLYTARSVFFYFCTCLCFLVTRSLTIVLYRTWPEHRCHSQRPIAKQFYQKLQTRPNNGCEIETP